MVHHISQWLIKTGPATFFNCSATLVHRPAYRIFLPSPHHRWGGKKNRHVPHKTLCNATGGDGSKIEQCGNSTFAGNDPGRDPHRSRIPLPLLDSRFFDCLAQEKNKIILFSVQEKQSKHCRSCNRTILLPTEPEQGI